MNKPIPKPTAETVQFWDACSQGRLLFQYCEACRHAQFPPSMICRECGGTPEWRQSGGKGQIHSLTTVQRAPIDAFRADVPYVIALVDLDEGFRMMMNIRGAAPERAGIGTRIVVTFEDTGQGIALPQAVVDEAQA
jgi:uncharacterized OB-fold protein